MSSLRVPAALIVAMLLCLATLAHGGPAPDVQASDVEAESPVELMLASNDDLDFVRRRGIDLYERHQASLVALEAAREVGLADIAPEGWVTVREDDAVRVRFVGSCSGRPCGLLDVRIDRERLAAESLYPPVTLSEIEAAAWRAKQLVFASQDATCQTPYNAVTFPPEEEAGAWTVYLLPQPTEANVIALSGHMRVTVDVDASAILKAQDFSASCILVRRNADTTQLAIDYGWASMPAETHVLNSLLHQLMFFVGTGDGVFRVNGNIVERVADVAPGA